MSSGAGTGPAVWLWARTEIARRWKALVALGVLAGVAAGLAFAAVAGARRTDTAYGRWREATAAPDVLIFGTQLELDNLDYSPIVAMPEVIAAGRFSLSPLAIKEHRMGSLPPADDQLYRTVSRPLLRHGRLPDPHRSDEIVVNRSAVQRYQLHVGQRLTLLSANRQEAFFGQAPMTGGPTVPVRVVGIGDSMMDLIFGDEPSFVPSGALLKNAPVIPEASNLVVRLRPGTDLKAFRARVDAALHRPDVPIRNLAEDRKRFVHATEVERAALLLFAAAVALAGVVMVGQALVRSVYGMAEVAPALEAMGFTRGDVVRGLVLPMLLAAATAAVVAVGTAIALSTRFPVGLARSLDPSLGFHADWLVLAPGAVAVVIVVMLGAAFAAARASRAARRARDVPRGSAAARAIRSRAPLSIGIGAGLALESGRGEWAVPARPAIAGAVAGVLGVVGALGLVHGIDDALAAPARSGQVWDAVVWTSDSLTPSALAARLPRDRDVAAVMDLIREPLDVNGDPLPVYSIDRVRGNAPFVVLHGRAPRTADEAAIGPATARSLHVAVGDRVHVAGTTTADVRVVGTVLLPQTPHSSFDQGLWLTRARLATLADITKPSTEEVFPVTARAGMKPSALIDHLTNTLHTEVDPIAQPQDVLLLRDVRTLPRALAGFLALLGSAALAHALVTTVRRRRHDFAVLRALGLRPRQSATVIASQASTVALLGLLFGLPLGVVAGRTTWRWVAQATPLRYVAPIAVPAIVVVIPASIVLANALAAWPGRRVAQLRPARLLRTE